MFREKCRNTCGKNVYKIDSVKIRDDRYAIPFLYFFSSNEDNDFNFKNLNEKKLVWVSTKWKLLKLSWIFHIMILQLTKSLVGPFKRFPRDMSKGRLKLSLFNYGFLMPHNVYPYTACHYDENKSTNFWRSIFSF